MAERTQFTEEKKNPKLFQGLLVMPGYPELTKTVLLRVDPEHTVQDLRVAINQGIKSLQDYKDKKYPLCGTVEWMPTIMNQLDYFCEGTAKKPHKTSESYSLQCWVDEEGHPTCKGLPYNECAVILCDPLGTAMGMEIYSGSVVLPCSSMLDSRDP